LPGVTLSPGTHVFELAADPFNAPGVVRVLSGDRRKAYFMGFTNAAERPRGLRLDASVSLGESAAGAPPRITAWWPIGERTGRQFIYSDRWTRVRREPSRRLGHTSPLDPIQRWRVILVSLKETAQVNPVLEDRFASRNAASGRSIALNLTQINGGT